MEVHSQEKVWIAISLGMLLVFFLAVTGSVAFGGFTLPGPEDRVDPQTVAQTPPFDRPGIREIAPGRYEVYMIARVWSFSPGELRIPPGSTVTFYLTSPDVIHGFLIPGTDVNVMVIPGQVTRVSQDFPESGEFLILCSEYCGLGHQNMSSKIIVGEMG
jgi:cytochrome c oxidase subunit 2